MLQHEIITPDTNFGLFLVARRFAGQQALRDAGLFQPQPADAFARAHLLVEAGALPTDPFETTITVHKATLAISAKNNSHHIDGTVRVDHAFGAVFLGPDNSSEANGRTREAGRMLTEIEGLGLIEDMCRLLGGHTLSLAQERQVAG